MRKMKKYRKNIVVFVVIFLTLFSNVSVVFANNVDFYNNSVAQEDKINFYNITMKHGLSSNLITDIYQDSLGYIWIGTEDGLNQYNGNVIIEYNYDSNDECRLTSTCITSINEDRYENIWVGTDNGLNIINRSENKVHKIDKNGSDHNTLSGYTITSIYKDSKDTMWVGTTNGLNMYDEENDKFIKYYSDGTDRSINDNYITDMEEDNYGYLWVSTTDGVGTIDLDNFDIKNRKNDNNTVHTYKIDKDNEGNMWSVSKNGIYQITAGKYELSNYSIDIGEKLKQDITRVLCDSKGNIWFGGLNGLIKYTPSDNATKIYQSGNNSSNYLLSNSIRCLYEDRNGVLWIGTDNGVSILNIEQQFSNKINNLFKKYNISGNSITSFLEDNENDLWIGTEQSGIIYFNVDKNTMTRFVYDENNENSLSSNTIKSIIQGQSGKILAYTEKGINIIDKLTGTINKYLEEEFQKVTFFNQELKILNDGKYNWIATDEGLYRGNNEKYEVVNYKKHFIESGIVNYIVSDIYQDENDENILWLAGGRNGGLIKFHKTKGVLKNYLSSSESNSLSYDSINCIQGDGNGNLWIGTEVGLNKFNIKEESFTRYCEDDGLGSNYINSIIIDNNKDVWLGTSYGLSKFIISENRFINFTEVDGLCGIQFNKRAVYKTKMGHLLFGTTKGVVSFHPNNIKEVVSKENKIVIDNLWVNKELYLGKKENIELKYNENNISIQYFFPDYSRIEGIIYLYKMDGINEEWVRSTREGYASYSTLNPGNYTFRVKASKSDGSLTEESSISFVIKKPFWKSDLAYCLYIIVIFLIILCSTYYVQILRALVDKQTKEISSQMEENKRLYERNIRNEKFKNDYFVNLSHELRTPLNIILSVLQLLNSLDKNGGVAKEKFDNYMNVIKKSSNHLLNIINDIIDSSKIETGAYKINKQENVDIVYLVEETALNMSDYINNKGIELIIDPEIEEMPICCDPKEIERCIINLIGNAVKFTESGGEIKVIIEEDNDVVRISVEDSGIGISKEDQEFIFKRFEQGKNSNSTQVSSSGIGLTLVKYIIELHGGHVTLESELNKGSKFTIILPTS